MTLDTRTQIKKLPELNSIRDFVFSSSNSTASKFEIKAGVNLLDVILTSGKIRSFNASSNYRACLRAVIRRLQ